MATSARVLQQVRSILSASNSEHPAVKTVLDALNALTAEGGSGEAARQIWESARPSLQTLAQDGILDQNLVKELEQELPPGPQREATPIPEESLQEMRQVAQQFLSQLEMQDSSISSILLSGLSLELRELADMAFTLRALTLRPQRVLPPGKGLLSVFMSEPDKRSESERKRTAEVASTIKRAFWDAAIDQLASPELKDQIPRLNVLYGDLFTALRPFVPRSHPLMVTLSSPLSPTSNPLRSAFRHLKSTLILLRSLCAPVRDPIIDQALSKLQAAEASNIPHREFAVAYVEGVRIALEMSDLMVEDYQNAVAKFGDESNARAILASSARAHEREVILSAFGGAKELDSSWQVWKGEDKSSDWKSRLLDLIGTLDPLMQANEDVLPPILRLSKIDIAECQTLLHGLLIAAGVRSLVPPLNVVTRSRLSSEQLQVEDRFTETLWNLLGADPATKSEGTQPDDIERIKDEVIRLWRLRHREEKPDETKEAAIRDLAGKIVDDDQHPVRLLLHKRLRTALLERLNQSPPSTDMGPGKLKAGRTAPNPTPRLKSRPTLPIDLPEPPLHILGFEDPVFRKIISQILGILRIIVYWVEFTWKDIIVES